MASSSSYSIAESPPVGRAEYDLLVGDVESGKGIKRLFTEDTPKAKLECVAISPDNKYVVGASQDLTLKVWDIGKGKQIETIPGFGRLNIEFGHAGKILAVGNDNQVELWDWQKRARIVQFEPGFTMITSLRFSADDHWLAAAGTNGRVVVFDVQQRSVAKTLQQPTTDREHAVCAISRDGSRVVGVDGRQTAITVVMWDAKSGNETFRIREFPFLPDDVAYRTDDVIGAIAGAYEIALFDANTGRHMAKIRDPRKVRNPRHGPILHRLWFLGDRRIAARNAHREVLLWELPRALWQKEAADQ
jgi:WD40 repeat protein